MDRRKAKSPKSPSSWKTNPNVVTKRLVAIPSINFISYAEQAGKESLPVDKMQPLLDEAGVYKRVLKPGTELSLQVTDSCHVWIHHETFVEKDGRLELVASTRNSGPLANLEIDECGSSGMKIALKSMKKREIAEFRFLPKFALGIPGVEAGDNTTQVKVVIELMSIFKRAEGRRAASASLLGEEEKKRTLAEYSLKRIIEYVENLREAASKKFRAQRFDNAYTSYHWAICVLDDHAKVQADMVPNFPRVFLGGHKLYQGQAEVLKQAYKLYSNLALCTLHMEDYATMEKICEIALLLKDPTSKDLKIFHLHATALLHVGKFKLAMNACALGLNASSGQDRHQFMDLRRMIMRQVVQEAAAEAKDSNSLNLLKRCDAEEINDRTSSLRKMCLQYFNKDGVISIRYNN